MGALSPPHGTCADTTNGAASDWRRFKTAETAAWANVDNGVQTAWQAETGSMCSSWRREAEDARHQWGDLVRSTQTIWVSYATTADTRSLVDFKRGIIEVETITKPKEASRDARRRITNQFRRILGHRSADGSAILEGLLATRKGRPLNRETLPGYIATEIVPNIKPVKRSDKKSGVRYRVDIPLLPDHVQRRADRYAPLVEKYARRYGISPALVMSIIHAESFFNPVAVSKSGAVGLMQLVPETGGRDAATVVYGRSRQPSVQALFDPETNIHLGVAYLHLLQNQYFLSEANPEKRRFLIICGYNWGPSVLRRKVLKRYNYPALEKNEAFSLLTRTTPRETAAYLAHVEGRISSYQAMFL